MVWDRINVRQVPKEDVEKAMAKKNRKVPILTGRERGSQPTHIDIDDLSGGKTHEIYAGVMYFSKDMPTTVVYDNENIEESIDMEWPQIRKQKWTDCSSDLIVKLVKMSSVGEDGIDNDNPGAWLATCGRLLYADWYRRLSPKIAKKYDILYFPADSPHCGPVLSIGERLSYFSLLVFVYLIRRGLVRGRQMMMIRRKRNIRSRKKDL